MNRIGVLKDVAYGAKIGGGTVANLGEAGLLQAGAWALFNPAGVILDAALATADAVLSDQKDVVIAVGRADATSPLIVTVPRVLKDLNRKNAVAAVLPILQIGGTTAADSLSFENEGDITVKVFDTTYSSRFGIPSIRASVYKTANMTAEQAVDAVVAKLNAASEPFGVTAAKIGSDPNFGITITPNDYRSIEIALDGMFANDNIQTNTAATYGMGTPAQVLQMEKDFSVEEGNGNYIEFGTDFFSRTYEAASGATYDLITFLYDAYHSGPVTKRHVSSNRLILAAVNGGTNDADAIMTILAAVFPTAGSATTGVETAEDAG